MTNHLQLAREHLTEGERLLRLGKGVICDGEPQEISEATAHFLASMAHTNMLLADPAELPEPAER